MASRCRGHPFRDMRERAVGLLDHHHGEATEAMAPEDRHPFAMAWMKRIVNSRELSLIPGSMSLSSRARARVTWRPPLGSPRSGPAEASTAAPWPSWWRR
jgi:hypothetical protein